MSFFEVSSILQGTAFEPNAILRGAQLTIVGAHRALQNPALFTTSHYKQAALAVLAGLAIRLLVSIPTYFIRSILLIIGLFTDLSHTTWDDYLVNGLHYIENHVLQVPFFLVSFMRYLSPAMDHMFMDSLLWVDETYTAKHAGENADDLRAMYYPNLKQYDEEVYGDADVGQIRGGERKKTKDPRAALQAFLLRFGKKAALSLGVYVATFVPYVGRFVLPAASFYTFNQAVGTPAAVVIFGSGIFMPKRYLVMFLQSYFSSRSMMRELVRLSAHHLQFFTKLTMTQLDPYLSRIRFSRAQRAAWFHERSGVLYGFAFSFFLALKIPLVGVLIYGIAEASTAYLVTKITEPPPPPPALEEFRQSDVHWKNKKAFLSMPLHKLDRLNIKARRKEDEKPESIGQGRTFT